MKTIVLCAALLAFTSLARADEALLAKGKEIYNGKGACMACHGVEGKGDGAAAVALNPKPRSFAGGEFLYDTDGDGAKGSAADLANIINKGAAAFGGSMFMAARPDITGEELAALIAYVQSLKAP
jgi:mono/diheme cytochrome c family protein